MGDDAARYGDDNWVVTRMVRMRDDGDDIIPKHRRPS